MNWLYVRVGLLVFVVISSFLVPLQPHAVPRITWSSLAVIAVFCPLALLFLLWFQVVNPRSAKVWRPPSWCLNPFTFKEPLQFFHLAAYICLAQGAVTVGRLLFLQVPFYVEALVPLVMGIGVLIGVRLSMAIFRSKAANAGA